MMTAVKITCVQKTQAHLLVKQFKEKLYLFYHFKNMPLKLTPAHCLRALTKSIAENPSCEQKLEGKFFFFKYLQLGKLR